MRAISTYARLKDLRLAQRLLRRNRDSLLLVDEMEDLLSNPVDFLSECGAVAEHRPA